MGYQGLAIQDLNKTFKLEDGEVQALKDITLTVNSGEFISIVGTSGCGKSTLLRIIGGLETNDNGSITIGGTPIQGPGNDRGMVFQEARLFPWLSVRDNIAFGIGKDSERSLDKGGEERLVNKFLELVGLENFANAYPYQLSGGMQQRVSIARSLIGNPKVLLLDEPFGALDAMTRINMQHEILRIWEAERTTMILVTHDIDEAIYLGDKVFVMSSRPGTIRKVVNVELARPRDRSSYEFVQVRKSIFQEFFEERSVVMEYNI